MSATPVTAIGKPAFAPPPENPDHRRFRLKHALRSLEDALMLLDRRPAAGIDIPALERVRDDLRIVLRLAEAECP